MCMKRITANEGTKFLGRPACATRERLLVPIVKGETPETSLAIYTPNEFRVDRKGKRIIDRNPLEPVDCPGMLESMELGLTEAATVLWVRLLASFASETVDDAKQEVDGDVMLQLMRATDWAFSRMRGVEIAPPCMQATHKATHWLVKQPLEGTDICWNALKRDALGFWETSENVYFVVPAGYSNVIQDMPEETAEGMSKAEFYETNSLPYREFCQKELDRPFDEDRARKAILPALKARAEELVQSYAQVAKEKCLQGEPELQFDAANEELIYGEESERLTEQALEKFEGVLQQLQRRAIEYHTQSQRVDGFRELLRDLSRNVTIRDFYGVLNQTANALWFEKPVEIELAEKEATITVLSRNGEVRSQKRFQYSDLQSATGFNAELERLHLKRREYGDEDGFFEETAKMPKMARRSLREMLMSVAVNA